VNGTYHVPVCDFFNNGTLPRCSGFYHVRRRPPPPPRILPSPYPFPAPSHVAHPLPPCHLQDQEQTPNHRGGGKQYPVDGECITQCDCGTVNPCGEYIFNHGSTAVVDGMSFRQWFIYDYMISNETLTHVNPQTGEPQMISLGWMDDSMTLNGPTEEDSNYIADTGASPEDMQAQVDAYRTTIVQFNEAVYAAGGFTWMMMDWGGARLNTGINNTTDPVTCKAVLASSCTTTPPTRWNRFQGYAIPGGGFGMTPQGFTDYTAEFLLTRGPYALLGYT
jgi:hypothetical protein